jgi:hypothetical protein
MRALKLKRGMDDDMWVKEVTTLVYRQTITYIEGKPQNIHGHIVGRGVAIVACCNKIPLLVGLSSYFIA